jgi:hypothetical protein
MVSARNCWLLLTLFCWVRCDATSTPPTVTSPWMPNYTAILLTDAAHAEAFGRLARIHTLTGVPTELVTVEAICEASATSCASTTGGCNDTAKVIKDYLALRHDAGLRHVVIGGDMTLVPSRQTSDTYANPLFGASYQRSYYTDYYYADLSDWDTNGDCVYGEPGADTPDYRPELAVTRIPAAAAADVEAYIAKVERYLVAYDTDRIGTALFLSNVATQLSIPSTTAPIPIDSALYFENGGRTLSLIPRNFAVTKLYSSLANRPDASSITVSAEIAALEAGNNLVVHAGHGSADNLTAELDGSQALTAAMALDLRNAQLPILLSSACEAADLTGSVASAGRNFVLAPRGGGIGYLGNSTIGLGLAGGMQFIDEALRYAFANPNPLVGEAIRAAHENLPTSDSFSFMRISVPVVDENAWRWTQKAASYLGDGLVPIYTNVALRPAPTFAVSTQHADGYVTVSFNPSTDASGTLTVAIASNLYQLAVVGDGQSVSLTMEGSPTSLDYGFASPATLSTYQHVGID